MLPGSRARPVRKQRAIEIIDGPCRLAPARGADSQEAQRFGMIRFRAQDRPGNFLGAREISSGVMPGGDGECFGAACHGWLPWTCGQRIACSLWRSARREVSWQNAETDLRKRRIGLYADWQPLSHLFLIGVGPGMRIR